ncbi:MAG: hypothetical protein Sylvanvirus10_31 [Sylvanvirus sp.]|uniref:Uncharacterized protein n=1 Tax=Sylvanvirus sp. TaxID=2487774 RepID=A0A3G5AJG8_9VIRU|nr:MAG: hypothetical protein Sylvanvirus10_31 [Sylvanvirus sp.]
MFQNYLTELRNVLQTNTLFVPHDLLSMIMDYSYLSPPFLIHPRNATTYYRLPSGELCQKGPPYQNSCTSGWIDNILKSTNRVFGDQEMSSQKYSTIADLLIHNFTHSYGEAVVFYTLDQELFIVFEENGNPLPLLLPEDQKVVQFAKTLSYPSFLFILTDKRKLYLLQLVTRDKAVRDLALPDKYRCFMNLPSELGETIRSFAVSERDVLILMDSGKMYGLGMNKFGIGGSSSKSPKLNPSYDYHSLFLSSIHTLYRSDLLPPEQKIIQVFATANNSFFVSEQGKLYMTGVLNYPNSTDILHLKLPWEIVFFSKFIKKVTGFGIGDTAAYILLLCQDGSVFRWNNSATEVTNENGMNIAHLADVVKVNIPDNLRIVDIGATLHDFMLLMRNGAIYKLDGVHDNNTLIPIIEDNHEFIK